MSERDSGRLAKVARGVSRGIGVGLAIWALYDGPLIGGGPGFGFTQAAVMSAGLLLLGSSFAPLSWNGRALALVLSTGFMLVIGEVGARVLFSARYQPPFQLDEQFLYRLVPNSLREFQHTPVNGGEVIRYRVNSRGFRGDELASAPRARIVVYGDSFIQAEFSTLENTFTERLEAHLSQRLGFDVEVVNAGVAGYGPDQALLKMQDELAALAPDLLVVAIFSGNDFGDMVRNKLFRVDASGALVETAFTIDPEARRVMEVRSKELLLKRVLRDAVHTLAVALNLREADNAQVAKLSPRDRLEFFRAQHVREYEEYVVEGNDVVRELAWDTYDADVSLTPASDSARYKVRLMDAVIGRIQSLAAELSVPMLLVPIPHPIDVGGHDTGEVDLETFPEYQPGRLVGFLEDIAVRRGIPNVDLAHPFRELGTAALYLRGFDDHWNERGQDLAAERTAELILQDGLLGARGIASSEKDRGR